MMKKALSVALCLLMAGTVLTACSNPDEFSDTENLSLKYTRSDKTDDTFNYADGAKTAPSSYDTYSAKITQAFQKPSQKRFVCILSRKCGS